MDNIVKYSVHETKGKQLDKPTVLSLRLVNKSWLGSVSRFLKKSDEWTIEIVIDHEAQAHLNNEPYDENKGGILNQFASVFSKASIDSTLPIYLGIEASYFIKENSKKLRTFLEKCSDRICGLCVKFPLDGGSLTLKCSDLSFPILQSVNFEFETCSPSRKNKSTAPVFGTNANGLKLLREVLQNSGNLKYFTLNNKLKAEVNVSSLKLPGTLKMLRIHGLITGNELDLLTKNKLPYLDVLSLIICNKPEEDLIYKILEHFRLQLKKLDLSFEETKNDLTSVVRLPEMKKLKTFALYGHDIDLFPQMRHVWQRQVPNLNRLIFGNITEPTFFDWVQGAQFENVKKLNIGLQRTDEFGEIMDVSPNAQIFWEINASFPKIEKLTLTINLLDDFDLSYLFRNFSHLKKFHLDFDFDDTMSPPLPGYKIVSSFLGISLELAKAIINKKEKNVKIATNNPDSIMNLKGNLKNKYNYK